jgi:hypothetical protein
MPITRPRGLGSACGVSGCQRYGVLQRGHAYRFPLSFRLPPRLDPCQADAAADEVLERFQTGNLAVEAFVDQYVTARENFHIIDLKRQAAEHSTLA